VFCGSMTVNQLQNGPVYSGRFQSETKENAHPNSTWLSSPRTRSWFPGLWKRAQDSAALEREARFSKPFSDSLLAFQQKRYVDAEAILTGLLQETERDSPGSIHQASVLHGLGAVTYLQHRDSEAAAYYKRAVEIRKKLLKPDDPELVSALSGLAQALRDKEDDTEADQYPDGSG
jgi:hypothetical protein